MQVGLNHQFDDGKNDTEFSSYGFYFQNDTKLLTEMREWSENRRDF